MAGEAPLGPAVSGRPRGPGWRAHWSQEVGTPQKLDQNLRTDTTADRGFLFGRRQVFADVG